MLLQDAWRAPEGKVDPDEMAEAIEACLRIAHQLDDGMPIQRLVSLAIRHMTYETAQRALERGVFGADHIRQLDDWLASNDAMVSDCPGLGASEVADLSDLLQFAYAPDDGTWRLPPRPNRVNVQKLVRYCTVTHEEWPMMNEPPLDLAEEGGVV